MYAKFIKRPLDIILSFFALIILSPVLLILTIAGAIAMKGNPFYTQQRPGKIDKKTGKETIFRLIKFRSMSNAKDKNGELLPDDQRLNRYGRILRKTSLDELGELINILKGDMSFVGPRPLLVRYLEYYTQQEHRRHEVRPGLTGPAQINGRNVLSWENRFQLDVEYVDHISFKGDVAIMMKTFLKVIKRSDIQVSGTTDLLDFDEYRISQRSAGKDQQEQ